ncbi:GNAT family N-acetyltransferase [Vibrio sp. SCSIO 43136]|nr:GNAT family N-acetyltransferase [Vibrio sp. SCSIO 43136]
MIRAIGAEQTVAVRRQVLWPHKPASFCILDEDQHAYHYGVFIDDELVCVASLFADEHQVRLRKFATLETFQGQGIGGEMFQYLLMEAKQKGFEGFWCDARQTAVRFYQKFGLRVVSDTFYKSEVAYVRMQTSF